MAEHGFKPELCDVSLGSLITRLLLTFQVVVLHVILALRPLTILPLN